MARHGKPGKKPKRSRPPAEAPQAPARRTYRVVVKPAADKELDRISGGDVRQSILKRIFALGANPRPAGMEPIKGSDKTYRIRVGDYRVVYTLDDAAATVTVTRIGHRKDVYRGL